MKFDMAIADNTIDTNRIISALGFFLDFFTGAFIMNMSLKNFDSSSYLT
jgi:hypothetical protein